MSWDPTASHGGIPRYPTPSLEIPRGIPRYAATSREISRNYVVSRGNPAGCPEVSHHGASRDFPWEFLWDVSIEFPWDPTSRPTVGATVSHDIPRAVADLFARVRLPSFKQNQVQVTRCITQYDFF